MGRIRGPEKIRKERCTSKKNILARGKDIYGK
jgi:hypothetical protein